MAVEIELKARLDDFEPVRERLFTMGEYCRAYFKSDTYWLPAPEGAWETAAANAAWRTDVGQLSFPSGVRVRRESGVDADGSAFDSVLVTYKTKETVDNIEINDESEFTVSDAAPFEELLGRLGLREAHHKEKKGWAWVIAPVTSRASVTEPAEPQADAQPAILAELSLVTGLGWFLEIEIQAADSRRQTVEESRRRLLTLLAELEIPSARIESRPYTQMLRERVEE